jgi:hypothetical protein
MFRDFSGGLCSLTMAEEDPRVLNQLAGMGIAALSVLLAAVVSAVRLRPYLEAGVTWTPLGVVTYPAIIALGVAVLTFSGLRARMDRRAVLDIGPVSFSIQHSAVIVGCLAYVAIALLFFS